LAKGSTLGRGSVGRSRDFLYVHNVDTGEFLDGVGPLLGRGRGRSIVASMLSITIFLVCIQESNPETLWMLDIYCPGVENPRVLNKQV